MRRISPLIVAACAAALTFIPVHGASALPAVATPVDAGSCELIEVNTAAPFGVGTCPGVRPGGVVVSDVGQCTLNFLFQGSDGNRYAGTAGHCVLEAPAIGGQAGEHTWSPQDANAPVAFDADGNRIGQWSYAVLQDPKDFSLIRLDAGVASNPQMCHFGGPTGINSDTPPATSPTTLEIFGNGVAVGTVLPARSMVAIGMPDPDHVYAQGVVVPGDSGSGVISADGRAVGVAVTTGVHSSSIGTSGLDAGEVGITRLAPQVARASVVTGVAYTLLTAPLL